MSKSIYPSIPDPGNSIPTIVASLLAIKQTLELIIVNAQNPRQDYDLTTASQIFLTRASFDKEGKIAGPPGPMGPEGPQGLPGTSGISDAPNDINTYGRYQLTWQPILAAVNARFTTLPINAVDDTTAATAGVPAEGIYRNGSVLMVRVV